MGKAAVITELDTSVKYRGFTVTARAERDECMGAPWDEHDGHGIVSEWTTRAKRPGERVLVSDRNSRRYYDVAASIALAKRDGWDAPPYGGTAGQRAARAVEADFEHLRRWCADDWQWVVVVVEVRKAGILLGTASTGGIESSETEYLIETANELLPEAIAEAKSAATRITAELAK